MAIVIDVKLADSNATSGAIGRLEKAIARLDEVVARMNAGLSQSASTTGQIASNMGRAAQSAHRMNAASNNTPYQDPAALQNRLRARVMAGDPEAIKEYLRAQRLINAQQRAQKLAGGQGDSLQDILSRTRFANVFGMRIPMPLGRDIKSLGGMAGINVGNQFAGIGAKLAPLAGVIAPVVLALTAMAATVAAYTKIAGEGYKALRQFTEGLTIAGGSIAESGGAQLSGKALGLSPAYAAELGARIGSDATARLVASKAGVGGLRGYYGDINDAKAMRKVLDYLGRLPYEQARREAIGLGDARLAEFSRYDRSLQNRLLNPSMRGAQTMDVIGGARAAGEMAVLNEEFAEFQRIMAGPGIQASIMALRALSTTLEGLNLVASTAIQPLTNKLILLNKTFEMISDFIAQLTGNGKKDDPALKELKDINKGIKQMNDGVYGGGPRARGSNLGPRGGPADDPALDRAIRSRQLGTGMI